MRKKLIKKWENISIQYLRIRLNIYYLFIDYNEKLRQRY